MTIDALARARPVARRISLAPFARPLAVALVLAISLPMLTAPKAHLTSDESLYLAEAYNVAHRHGFTYPSGDAITHRAPLQPLLLAPAVRLGGPDAAYAVSKAIVVIDALLVLALAWRIGGALAGSIAGSLAAASAYLSGLGTTLYLDPLQCAFLLATLLLLHHASRDPRRRWFVLAGVSLGLGLLAKESAVQWAPLGIAAWLALPALRSREGMRGAAVFSIALVATVAPWWIWVYAHDRALFMLGGASPASMLMLLAAMLGLAGFAASAQESRPRVLAIAERWASPLLAAFVLAWGVFMLAGLTRYATWPYPNRFWDTLPSYLGSVAPQAQPYFLLAAAWGWALVRSRRDDGARLLLVAAALFAPFAIFAANRNLQLRDALPLVYLSYILLGLAAADVITRARRAIADPTGEALMLGLLAVALAGVAFQQQTSFRHRADAASSLGVRADNWDSTFVDGSAAWLEANLPPGSRVLTSRLYFSSLYVRTGGRFEVRQLPTERVEIDPASEFVLQPRSVLFRWGDDDPPPSAAAGDRWLSLRRFPGKGYWVGLREQELLRYIDEHQSDYLVLTGEDVAFSSLSYAGALTASPAFRLVYWRRASAGDQFFVYAIDRTRLAPLGAPLAISPRDLASLEREAGVDAAGLSERLGQPVRVTDEDWGLSPREQWAAATESAP